jgi:polyisoprenoid-binding protein YceI
MESKMLRRIVSVAVLSLMFVPVLASGADYALNGDNTTITFVGSKPQGKHDGGFKSVSGTASVPNNDPTKLKITLDIDMNSLWSDTPKLTAHLKSPDFFGVNSNPKGKFVTTKVEKAGGDYNVTGDLTMIGQTKSVTFPAKVAVSGTGLTLTSNFSIDRSLWGMKYGRGQINDMVKVAVSIKAK